MGQTGGRTTVCTLLTCCVSDGSSDADRPPEPQAQSPAASTTATSMLTLFFMMPSGFAGTAGVAALLTGMAAAGIT